MSPQTDSITYGDFLTALCEAERLSGVGLVDRTKDQNINPTTADFTASRGI